MSIPTLDPRFGKLVALMQSTTHEAERSTARRKAEALLTPEVGGFDRALRILAYEKARAAAAPNSFFSGFDEFQEIDNPGHIARQTIKRAEKQRAAAARRAELVVEFGSLEAVLKPSAREKALLEAVRPWRKAQPGSRGKWTESLAGLQMYDYKKAPIEVVEAVKDAIPWPTTYADARAEVAFWRRRDDDMQLAVTAEGETSIGDYILDMPAVWRMWLVQDLADHRMPLLTLPEIIDRLRVYRCNETGTNLDVDDAIIRDLEALDAAQRGTADPAVTYGQRSKP